MKTVTDAEILAFHSGTQKTLKLTFSNGTILQNDSIVSESLEIKQSISESDQISFATVYASELHISVLPLTRFKGLKCTVEITAGSYSRVLGTYTIVSDDSLSDYSARQLVGYDKLYSIIPRDYSVWHNGLDTQLTGTITLKQYRDAFFSLIGITQQEATLPNDNLAVNLPSLNTTLTGGQILGMICDLNQCWGYLEFDGTFRYVLPQYPYRIDNLYPSPDLYPAEDLYLGIQDTQEDTGADLVLSTGDYYVDGLSFSNFECQQFDQIVVHYGTGDETVSYGNEGNAYTVEKNIFTQVMSQEQLQTLMANALPVLQLLTYTPVTVRCQGRPWAQLGDKVCVHNWLYSYHFPILERTLSGITGLDDTYSARGVETNYDYANSLTRQVNDTKDFAGVIKNYVRDSLTFSTTSVNNGDGTTTGIATVYRGNEDVSNQFADAWFNWYIVLESGSTLIGHGLTCTVNNDDFLYGGVLKCVFQTYTQMALSVSQGVIVMDNSLTISAIGD